MSEFVCDIDNDLLLQANAFKKIAATHGKSKRDMRDNVRKATTIFLHYVIDSAVQRKQGSDDQRQVSLMNSDIIRALNDLGFGEISNKIISGKK